MKYLCIGYFDAEKMRSCPKQEIDALMTQCQPHLDALYGSGRVLWDVGVSEESKRLRRVNGNLTVLNGLADNRGEIVGSAFLLEARDMEEAIHLASLHPATQILAGEQLGWQTEIRPVHYFHVPAGLVK